MARLRICPLGAPRTVRDPKGAIDMNVSGMNEAKHLSLLHESRAPHILPAWLFQVFLGHILGRATGDVKQIKGRYLPYVCLIIRPTY